MGCLAENYKSFLKEKSSLKHQRTEFIQILDVIFQILSEASGVACLCGIQRYTWRAPFPCHSHAQIFPSIISSVAIRRPGPAAYSALHRGHVRSSDILHWPAIVGGDSSGMSSSQLFFISFKHRRLRYYREKAGRQPWHTDRSYSPCRIICLLAGQTQRPRSCWRLWYIRRWFHGSSPCRILC